MLLLILLIILVLAAILYIRKLHKRKAYPVSSETSKGISTYYTAILAI